MAERQIALPDGDADRVLITGGTSGIGLATALRYARKGARIAVLARSAVGLEAAKEQTAAAGSECLAFAADVTDRQSLRDRLDAAVGALGGLDVAVVNVGASTYGCFRDTSVADFDRVFEVTFRSAVDTVRETLPHLEASRGSLVVVGSVAGELPLPRMAAYTASKHALRGFVDTLRIELDAHRSGVALSLVEPGPVDTPFWHNVASVDRLLPPSFPLAYRPEEVAMAIERSASRRTARSTVGATWALVRLAHSMARPFSERLLARLMLLAESRGDDGGGRGAIWNPSGTGELRAGLLVRPSLLVRARGLAARAARRSRSGGRPAASRPIDGICEITLQAQDPDELSRFYSDVFGCREISREEGRIWLACGRHSRLGIWSPGRKEFGDQGGRHVHFALSCAPGKLSSLAERLRQLGIDHRGPVEHAGGDRSIYVEDPDRNVVEIWDFFRRPEGNRHGVAALAD